MHGQTAPRENVLFLGLDDSLAAGLTSALAAGSRCFYRLPLHPSADCAGTMQRLEIGVVFCPAEMDQCLAVLHAARSVRPGLPVIVVSAVPQASAWLDAVEAGAADYCCPPFEGPGVNWILDGALASRPPARAGRLKQSSPGGDSCIEALVCG